MRSSARDSAFGEGEQACAELTEPATLERRRQREPRRAFEGALAPSGELFGGNTSQSL